MRCALILLASVPLVAGLPRGTAQPRPAAEASFQKNLLPLLQQKCFACHGDDAKKLKGGLDLRTREGMLRGGQSGSPALRPGDPAGSLLLVAVGRQDADLVMPPKENDKLTAEQVEWLRRWIAEGAPWPTAGGPAMSLDGVLMATSGGRTADWTNRRYKEDDLWAYRPRRMALVPANGAAHPIDAFLQARRLAKQVQQTAPPADHPTLLRRVCYDLTGLPPAPAEIEQFCHDAHPDAFPRAIDRLLASPHYGEQQARHWLDVVRYADTSGFANDYERPSAWRYRDYVVRSFNQDKPFDRFVVEQIAGDELDPANPEMLLAVGFLRMGPWEHTGMSVAVVTRQQFLDDVTHSVGVAFLGQGLRCAACHDHKFDPIPTKDYYRLQAVFAPVQFAERDVPFLPSENTGRFREGRSVVEQRLGRSKAAVAQLQSKSQRAIAASVQERGVAKLADLPESDRPQKQRHGLSKLEISLIRIEQKRVEYFERELNRYQPLALSVYNGPANNYNSNKAINPLPPRRTGAIPEVRILPGGSLEASAEAVTPGVLSAAYRSNDALKPTAWNTVPTTPAGRRLALAQWIASPHNTLTARVIVNRVWQGHFGTGLVATPNNFGKMGRRPSHPELLDWLTSWFIAHDWSLKQLHRLILTSATYQQSSEHPDPAALRQLDPKNELLAFFPPRRLAAEEIRDSLLALSGELNPEVGGPPVCPEINWEAALQPRHVMGSVAPAYQPSPRPEQRHRRTLYGFRCRTLADPLQEVFNRPGSEISCERRDETTVTPQVFALFNGAFVHGRALALAHSLAKCADPIAEAFRRCYGRAPTADEHRLGGEHVTRMTAHHERHPAVPAELPMRVKRKMVEEQTGEEYEWEEELDGLVGYERDLQPWQVGPATRALADLCLVLMNSNEFLYVR